MKRYSIAAIIWLSIISASILTGWVPRDPERSLLLVAMLYFGGKLTESIERGRR